MKQIFVLIFLIGNGISAFAQDTHFSQYFATPMNLNPALAGAFDGSFRVSSLYRDQWRGTLDAPITAFTAGLDLRFQFERAAIRHDAIGAGLVFTTDRISGIGYSNNQMALFGSYHKSLDINTRQFLSLGFQLGVSQRNINYENLTFNDQFNGIDQYTLPTGEELPENNFAYADMSAGLFYTVSPSRKTSYYLGAAFHHINQPNIDYNLEGDEKLYLKSTIHIGARLPIGREAQLFPRLLASIQGPHIEASIGTSSRFNLSDYNGFALHLGSWVRPVMYDESFGVDAVVVMAGVEFSNVLFGLSYDIDMHDVINYQSGQGSFEISVAYLGDYENESIICPTF